jgi:hypothetical protein
MVLFESVAIQDCRRGVEVSSLDEDRTRLAASLAEEEDRLFGVWCDFDAALLADDFVPILLRCRTVGAV